MDQNYELIRRNENYFGSDSVFTSEIGMIFKIIEIEHACIEKRID